MVTSTMMKMIRRPGRPGRDMPQAMSAVKNTPITTLVVVIQTELKMPRCTFGCCNSSIQTSEENPSGMIESPEKPATFSGADSDSAKRFSSGCRVNTTSSIRVETMMIYSMRSSGVRRLFMAITTPPSRSAAC